LKSIFTQPLKQSLKPYFSKHKSIHPHSTLSNAFCKTLEIEEKASEAKRNLEKRVRMYLGKWRNKNPRFKNIKWSAKPVKALGVFHGYVIDLEMSLYPVHF
jgi:hypothetical protein